MFDFLFLYASEDVVCKVWCRLGKRYGRSSEKAVERSSRFCENGKWAWPMPKYAADSSESVGITFWNAGGSVWEL